MALLIGRGSNDTELTAADLGAALREALDQLGHRRRVLLLPPDASRQHSQAGLLTEQAWEYFRDAVADILPALGTHRPMTPDEIAGMFGQVPSSLFRVHDWRHDVVTLGEVPAAFVQQVSEELVTFSWPAQVNRLIRDGQHDLILSIGQVVPHEVVGMANGNKNVFIGTGGAVGINRSHYLGAVYGMERIMGRADTPVRAVLNYASEHFARSLPIVYVLTVVGKNSAGRLVTRGLFIGDDQECFARASEPALQVNFTMLDREIRKAVVYLDPSEFKSTWLGNKSIYRTRMAIADGGELIVLGPGIREFGEDATIDRLIRRYGYRGTPAVLQWVKEDPELAENLSAAAHLIHGSSEGRFNITYCPGHMTQQEIENAGYRYQDLAGMIRRYDPAVLQDGWNRVGGEEIYFISHPGLGLWAYEGRFRPQT